VFDRNHILPFVLGAILVVAGHVPLAQGYTFDADRRAASDFCFANTVNICGDNYMLSPGPLGSMITVTMPDRFVRSMAMVQCVNNGGASYYSILQDAQPLCALKTCKPANVNVCGAMVPVEQEMQVGDGGKVSVPPDLLAESKKGVASTFTIKCELNERLPRYTVVNTSGLSCNNFGCDPVTLRLCRDSVVLGAAAELGQVIKTNSQKGKPVSVQCLASAGQRPVYKVVDSSYLMCD